MVKSYRNQTTIYGSDIDGNNQSIDNLQSLGTDSAVIDGKRVYIQDTEPQSAEADDIWIDTS